MSAADADALVRTGDAAAAPCVVVGGAFGPGQVWAAYWHASVGLAARVVLVEAFLVGDGCERLDMLSFGPLLLRLTILFEAFFCLRWMLVPPQASGLRWPGILLEEFLAGRLAVLVGALLVGPATDARASGPAGTMIQPARSSAVARQRCPSTAASFFRVDFRNAQVPPDLWVIYNTRKACCDTNFLYSEICDVEPEMPEVPTKHPTIVLEDVPFEIIPLKFDLIGVPDDVRVRDLKEEMTVVLKRILLRLAESIPGMIIKEVEERVVLPNSRRSLREMVRGLVGRGNRARGLAQAVSLYYNVKVVRVEGKKFGPLIINEMRDSYDDIVEQIQ